MVALKQCSPCSCPHQCQKIQRWQTVANYMLSMFPTYWWDRLRLIGTNRHFCWIDCTIKMQKRFDWTLVRKIFFINSWAVKRKIKLPLLKGWGKIIGKFFMSCGMDCLPKFFCFIVNTYVKYLFSDLHFLLLIHPFYSVTHFVQLSTFACGNTITVVYYVRYSQPTQASKPLLILMLHHLIDITM